MQPARRASDSLEPDLASKPSNYLRQYCIL
jgi:hypothetical protein